jgi:hypothetical protein
MPPAGTMAAFLFSIMNASVEKSVMRTSHAFHNMPVVLPARDNQAPGYFR